jgi:tripartite-type tricarboxylate transporter receptor subunit TctC
MANGIGIYRNRLRTTGIIVSLLLACQWMSEGSVFGQAAPFYKDKTIRIIVGFTSGGLYDQYARLLARHMGKYIPGNPNIIVQNMPGAGSLSATNYVYGVAKPDGLTLGMPGSGIYLDQMLGRKEATFDVRKLHWLGSVDQRDLMLYMKADAPWKSIEDILNSKEAPKCGSTGTSDLTTILNNILEETLGANFKRCAVTPAASRSTWLWKKARFIVAAPASPLTSPASRTSLGIRTDLTAISSRPAQKKIRACPTRRC